MTSRDHPLQRRTLRSNFMSAFDLSFAPGTPESHSTIGMPDGPDAEELMLPTVEDGLFDDGPPPPSFAPRNLRPGVRAAAARDSGATVISTESADEGGRPSPPTYITTGRSKKRGRSKSSSARRASSSSSRASQSGDSGGVGTQSVPEFLCHLHTMLADRSIDRLISWEVPEEDEDEVSGGGIGGIGKIVVHRPEELQDKVLGNYYRHSRYASFQRQLNYFGFKKRLHGGKKGKLSPCSYIHEGVTDDARSLFDLKRRPPARKRTAGEAGLVDDSTVEDERAHKSSGGRSSGGKSRRGSNAGGTKSAPPPSSSRSRSKGKAGGRSGSRSRRSSSASRQEKQQTAAVPTAPVKVHATEYGAPSRESTGAIQNNLYYPKATVSIPNVVPPTRTYVVEKPKQPQKTLADLLSTYLPPASLLFDDDLNGGLVDVSPSGFCYHHKVDNAMVDLAMVPEV